MTLRAITAALGGDLYCGGRRASVPAPGHSAADRSVSLLLNGDRVVVHSFGEATWPAIRDHLRRLGLIDQRGRILSSGGLPGAGQAEVRPDRLQRRATAAALWDGAGPLGRATPSRRYLQSRAIRQNPEGIGALRHHPAAPVAVFRPTGSAQPALLAAITAPDEAFTAVELVYLTASGRRDDRLRPSRKTVGVLPPGSAVRLGPAEPEMLVGEGIVTVLSASERFGLSPWALLAANNLAAWRPPTGTTRVMIAADRGLAGETAAARLGAALANRGVSGRIVFPPGRADDWNAWAVKQRRKEGG